MREKRVRVRRKRQKGEGGKGGKERKRRKRIKGVKEDGNEGIEGEERKSFYQNKSKGEFSKSTNFLLEFKISKIISFR